VLPKPASEVEVFELVSTSLVRTDQLMRAKNDGIIWLARCDLWMEGLEPIADCGQRGALNWNSD
jgi:hypothetical protein